MKKYYIMMLLIVLVFLIIDTYTFKGLWVYIRNMNHKVLITSAYWFITLIFIGVLSVSFYFAPTTRDPKTITNFFYFGTFLMLILVPKLIFNIFVLSEDITYGITFLIKKINPNLSLHRFLWITRIGLGISFLFFLFFLFGFTIGKTQFKVRKIVLHYPDLPKSFNGIKIVQFSDIHIGSFYYNHRSIERAFELINKQNPDLVFFTGDLVNTFSDETNGWQNIFSKIKSTNGKFAILGNHDYGDYYEWSSKKEKEANLEKIINFHAETGFRLLLNESQVIKKGNDSIFIIGVENWGVPPFVQYGDLQKALTNVDTNSFQILLSHDPTHWDNQVIDKTNIQLTLSGHTHGMQFGIKIGNFQWSPVKYKYPKWGGLYNHKKQNLYVNRGLGVIGMMARIGMRPEITVFELKN